VVVLHANAIPEYGAVTERAAWIYSDYRNAALLPAQRPNKLIDERALAGARCPGDADDAPRSRTAREFAK
jgi:hypothetical protein